MLALRLIICLCGLTIGVLQAAVAPNRSATSSSGSTSSGSISGSPSSGFNSTPKTIEPLKSSQSTKTQQSTSQALPATTPLHHPTIAQPLTTQTSAYFHPGVLVFLNGKWEGGDHLYNLANTLGVYVEIIKPENDKVEVNAAQFQKIVESIFSQVGIVSTVSSTIDQPLLPFFHIQILLYPISHGYVACCGGRLFESINLKRIFLDPGMAFQAITWEKESLIVTPTETLIPQLEKTITSIAQGFAERFQANALRRRELENP